MKWEQNKPEIQQQNISVLQRLRDLLRVQLTQDKVKLEELVSQLQRIKQGE